MKHTFTFHTERGTWKNKNKHAFEHHTCKKKRLLVFLNIFRYVKQKRKTLFGIFVWGYFLSFKKICRYSSEEKLILSTASFFISLVKVYFYLLLFFQRRLFLFWNLSQDGVCFQGTVPESHYTPSTARSL